MKTITINGNVIYRSSSLIAAPFLSGASLQSSSQDGLNKQA